MRANVKVKDAVTGSLDNNTFTHNKYYQVLRKSFFSLLHRRHTGRASTDYLMLSHNTFKLDLYVK